MTLPPSFLIELRAAFRSCAHHTSARHNSARRSFQPTSIRYFTNQAPSFAPKQTPNHRQQTSQPSGKTHPTSQDEVEDVEQSKELVPKDEDAKQLDTRRTSHVPMRIIPTAKIAANTRLSPQERLHIEYLTRHPPPPKSTRPYRENLLVYRLGTFRITWMIFTRVFAISCIGFATVVYVPAYWNSGFSIWWLGLVWGATLIPPVVINWYSRGILTEIRLRLPPAARQSAQAALAYARNLPVDATLEARFQRWTSHTASLVLRVTDLVPTHHKVKLVNFKWTGPRVDPGSRVFPNPTEFWVNSSTAKGKAARDTVPGLWDIIYKRLTAADATPTHKWKG